MVAWRGSKECTQLLSQTESINNKKKRQKPRSIHPSISQSSGPWLGGGGEDGRRRSAEGAGGRGKGLQLPPPSLLHPPIPFPPRRMLLLLFSILIFLKFLSIDQSSPGANFLGNIEFFLFLCWRGSLRMHIQGECGCLVDRILLIIIEEIVHVSNTGIWNQNLAFFLMWGSMIVDCAYYFWCHRCVIGWRLGIFIFYF